MLILFQTPADAPVLPWWVLYAVLLAITFVTWRATRSTWWKGCLTAGAGWVLVLVMAVLALPASRGTLMYWVALAPIVAFAAGLLSAPRRAAVSRAFARPTAFPLPPQVMVGQPNPRSVFRSKVMGLRFAAGMPKDSSYLARVAFVSGLEGIEPKPVDLFVGGGSLWVAPLTPGTDPVPLALRDVLRVDVWPETDAPPTLRVSWSPPAGELTRELVLRAIPNVPPPLVSRHLGAIAGAVTSAMQHDERAALAARREPAPALAPARAMLCARCGEELPEGAARCPRCGTPR
ncbi:MAG: zinc ribbon domain-containing protein [Longimicrobiaceae bacterium]